VKKETEEQEAIAFIDLHAQYERIAKSLHEGIERVCKRGHYIMGEEVLELEGKLAAYAGVKDCVTCGNGTDALLLALMSWGVGPGDTVMVPGYTFVATAGMVAHLGAEVYFVDVEDNFLMSPESLGRGLEDVKKRGGCVKAVIPVDLFGRPCDYDGLREVSGEIKLLADAAQSYGGCYRGHPVGCQGDMTTTSFYPAKPLGCYGEGGAVFCNDAETAQALRLRRSHGEVERYRSEVVGLNSRFDTWQAVVLLEKLKIFEEELESRQRIAERYGMLLRESLGDRVQVPEEGDREGTHFRSTWAQYTIRLSSHRDEVRAYCGERGVPSVVYYPWPLSKQPAYRDYSCVPGGLGMSERLSCEALSLPMSPYLSDGDVERVVDVVTEGVRYYLG
jgi:dTDP-4-amino-4,6-dideoxygalactose transaminase